MIQTVEHLERLVILRAAQAGCHRDRPATTLQDPHLSLATCYGYGMPKKLALEPQSPKKKQGVSRNISKTGTWAFLVHGRLGNSSPSDRPALGAGWPGPLHQWPRVLDQTSSNTCDSSKGQLGEVCSCRMKVGGWNHVESPTIRFPGLGSARTNACVLSTAEKKKT